MATWTNYKTLTGNNVVKSRTPDPTGPAGLVINDNFKALADALEAMAARAGTKIYYGQIAGTSGGSDAALAGDYFLDTDDGNLYTLVGTVWTLVTCVKGTDGTNGTDGVGYIAAAINAAGELVLTKTDNSTVNVGAVKGATGAQGPAGATGAQGPQGATGAQGPAGADAEVSWTISTDNNSTSCSFATVNGTMKIFGNSAITALTLTAGSGWAAGHCSAVRFLSPSAAATLTSPTGWVFKGDACASSVFTPEASKAYLLTIIHDSVETLVTVLEVA
jgi:hypothetical protein